jgi:mono/diheme cytochrome c family protein
MVHRVARILRSLIALVPATLLIVGLGGCSLKHQTGNVVQGKELFVAKCGACHTLSHAGTTGTVGPNLDVAFSQDRRDKFSRSAIEGLVAFQIEYPNTAGVMPARLYDGKDAEDVAAYVADVAAEPGQDTGPLASAGAVSGTTAAAGKSVFVGVGGCGSCHTRAAAQKVRGTTLTACITKAITDPYAYIPSGYASGIMPSNFATRLKPNEITALVNFLSTAAK